MSNGRDTAGIPIPGTLWTLKKYSPMQVGRRKRRRLGLQHTEPIVCPDGKYLFMRDGELDEAIRKAFVESGDVLLFLSSEETLYRFLHDEGIIYASAHRIDSSMESTQTC